MFSTQAYHKQISDSTSLSRCFDGIGCFPGSQYHIQVDPSVTLKQPLADSGSVSQGTIQARN